MPVWKDIEPEQTRLERIRGREETVWHKLARLLEEDGGSDLDIRQDSDRPHPETYDSTPLYAKDDFVGGLFTEGMNPAQRFFSFGIDDKELREYGPVATWLKDYADLVFNSLDPSVSNFYVEATPWLSDMAVFGGGFLGQEEDMGDGGIITRAIPIAESFKDVDAKGDLARYHRKYQLNAHQARGAWPDNPPPMRDDQTFTFVQAIYPNPDFVPGKLGPRGMPWVSCTVSQDAPAWSIERGFHELPVHEIQWRRRSSRAWGTGPGHKALADMAGNDELQRAVLTDAQFAAEPILLVHDEDVMTTADLSPAALIYGGINDQGKERVKTLQRGENAQLSIAVVQQVRNQIREAFHFSLLQLVNRPQMTLGEFIGWKEEKLRILAPHLVCIHRGLAPFIGRRARILARQRRVPPPPPELLNGGLLSLKIEFVSPFVQVQKAGKARAALQVGDAAIALQPLRPDVGDNLNVDKMMRQVADGLAGDPELLNDPRVVKEIRLARAQQTAPDVALERGAQQASIVADVAHAKQALTSANQRGGGKS